MCVGCEDGPRQNQRCDDHPRQRPVAKARHALQCLHEVGLVLHQPCAHELRQQALHRRVRHAFRQDEQRDRDQATDVHAEMLEQRFVDRARDRAARKRDPDRDRQPRDQGVSNRTPHDSEPRSRYQSDGALGAEEEIIADERNGESLGIRFAPRSVRRQRQRPRTVNGLVCPPGNMRLRGKKASSATAPRLETCGAGARPPCATGSACWQDGYFAGSTLMASASLKVTSTSSPFLRPRMNSIACGSLTLRRRL